MIDDERRRCGSIRLLLNMVDKNLFGIFGITWCKRCDFPWGCCPCAPEDTEKHVYLESKEAIAAIGRVIGG